MRNSIRSAARIRVRVSGATAAAVLLSLLVTAVALARAASINLSGPHTAARGTPLVVKVSGYFNATKKHPYGANYAVVYQLAGTVSATAKQCSKHAKSAWGGPADKKTRAKTPTTPGHFSTTIKVKTPKAGSFTLCGVLGNYPYKGNLTKPHALLHYTVHLGGLREPGGGYR